MTEEKAIGLFKLRLNSILNVFGLYGMDAYIPEAIDSIVKEGKAFHEDLLSIKDE